jgi:acetoin utilization deacetylase AcuC-like enzyme
MHRQVNRHAVTLGDFARERTRQRQALLRVQLRTSGAMLSAARCAIECGIACAPVSGFHHAGYDTAAMFCTFNGLMVAAISALQGPGIKRVLILDLDFHYGNGTDDLSSAWGLGNALKT